MAHVQLPVEAQGSRAANQAKLAEHDDALNALEDGSGLPDIGTITPGAYTTVDVTVDSKGRIVAIANGAGGGGAPSGTGFAHVTSGVFDTPHEVTGDVSIGASGVATLAKARAAPLGEMIEIFASSAASSNNGNTNADIVSPATSAPIGWAFTPLVVGASDYVVLEFVSSYAGDIEIFVLFAMSAANTGNVALRCDVLTMRPAALGVGSGGNPATNWTPGTPGTITPGNDALFHSCASADFAGLKITGVQRGDFVQAIIQRPTASDTHTGDLRIYKCGVRAV